MSYRSFASTAALAAPLAVLVVIVLLTQAPVAGQSVMPAAAKAPVMGKVAPTAPSIAYKPPRTPDGHPDFQGVWTNNTVTPLQRPKGLAEKEFYTETELADVQKRESERLASNEDEGRPTEAGTAEDVHYDFSQFGLDRAQAKLAWNRRTSLISGPEGRIPALTPEARKRLADAAAKQKGHELDGPENRPLGARCLARNNVGPPLLPAAYNSNLQIVQGAGYIGIETEMIHDARVVAMNGRPHLDKNIRQWYGDSIGRWEGDTLVIDSTNFSDQNPFPGAQNLHVTERLTRVADDTILYQFTVEDPGMWAKPWSGELPITKIAGQLYEYACHEANYGLMNTLRGARVAEAAAAAKKAAK
jgi:hypothetical protein